MKYALALYLGVLPTPAHVAEARYTTYPIIPAPMPAIKYNGCFKEVYEMG